MSGSVFKARVDMRCVVLEENGTRRGGGRRGTCADLQDQAVLALATTALGLSQERGTGGALKDLTDTLTSLGRALQVIASLDVTGNLSTLSSLKLKKRKGCISAIEAA